MIFFGTVSCIISSIGSKELPTNFESFIIITCSCISCILLIVFFKVGYFMIANIVQILMGQLRLVCFYLKKSEYAIKMFESVHEVVKTKMSVFCKYCANFHGSIAIFFGTISQIMSIGPKYIYTNFENFIKISNLFLYQLYSPDYAFKLRYVRFANIVQILMGPLHIVLISLLLLEKSRIYNKNVGKCS